MCHDCLQPPDLRRQYAADTSLLFQDSKHLLIDEKPVLIVLWITALVNFANSVEAVVYRLMAGTPDQFVLLPVCFIYLGNYMAQPEKLVLGIILGP